MAVVVVVCRINFIHLAIYIMTKIFPNDNESAARKEYRASQRHVFIAIISELPGRFTKYSSRASDFAFVPTRNALRGSTGSSTPFHYVIPIPTGFHPAP